MKPGEANRHFLPELPTHAYPWREQSSLQAATRLATRRKRWRALSAMSSELHELIQKEIAAAELRIDAAGSVGQYQRVRASAMQQSICIELTMPDAATWDVVLHFALRGVASPQ